MGLQTRYLEFNSEKIPHYYLCNYRPVSAGLDELSKNLLNFKRGSPLDTSAWIECSLVELGRIEIEAGSLLLRALASGEQEATAMTTLDRLANELARTKHIFYQPSLLKKVRKTQQIKYLAAFEREKELIGLYSFEKSNSVKIPNQILIIDDILTTGATMRAIVAAIRKVLSSASIRIFTLASTDRESQINRSLKLSG